MHLGVLDLCFVCLRHLCAAVTQSRYGTDKAIFGYGNPVLPFLDESPMPLRIFVSWEKVCFVYAVDQFAYIVPREPFELGAGDGMPRNLEMYQDLRDGSDVDLKGPCEHIGGKPVPIGR